VIPARQAFTDTLLALAREDKRIMALATDSRGSVTLTAFAAELPEQFVECGIAEQNAVGIAAGLSNMGFIPFVCGPACFYSLRSAEQVKIDLAYSHSNVKVIGVSGGVSYGALGTSHHATQDVALMRAIPGIKVILPADAMQAAAMTATLLKDIGPAYVRMGRGPVPEIYQEGAPFAIGRANWLKEGNNAAVIACGEMVYHALEAAKLLHAAGIEASVIDMHTISPLDEEAVLLAARCGAVVTVEEHCVHGGLGSAVAEVICQKMPTRMRILGLPNEPLYAGNSVQVFEHYGLTAQGIAKAVQSLLEG
jgi:transketolase